MPNSLVSKTFTAGDRRTAIADILTDADGAAISLTGHTVAFLLVRARDNHVLLDKVAATVDDAATGKVSYDWGADGPPTPAGEQMLCNYWWVLTRTSDGKREHFPGDGPKRQCLIVRAL